jgi:hypothetical protein
MQLITDNENFYSYYIKDRYNSDSTENSRHYQYSIFQELIFILKGRLIGVE